MHPTIPKGNGYEQCTVPDTIALEPILLLLIFSRFANILPWPLVPFFQISPEEQWIQNHPQYLEIAVYMRPTTQAQTFLVAGHDECAGLQRQWRWEGEYSVSQFFYFTVYPSCSSGIRKTHLYGHFSHCLALVLTVSRTSNIRWLPNTKHPSLRKIRTLAGGQTKGGFGAWVKSESETEEKHEMFLIFCYFFLAYNAWRAC